MMPWSRLAGVLLLLSAELCGCSRDEPGGRQIGVWGLDYQSMPEYQELLKQTEGLPERQRKMRAAMAMVEAEVVVEFTKDTLIVQKIVGQKAVPYSVKSSDGDEIVLEVRDGNQPKELTLTLEGSDTLVTDLGMGGGHRFRFKRMYWS
jgi:hypothetical protein